MSANVPQHENNSSAQAWLAGFQALTQVAALVSANIARHRALASAAGITDAQLDEIDALAQKVHVIVGEPED